MGTSGLGNLLVEEGILAEADRRTIKRSCGGSAAAFAKSIVAMGLLDENELAAFLAARTSHRVAPKQLNQEISADALGIIDHPLIQRLEVLPLKVKGKTLVVAMADPLDLETLRQLQFFTGYKIQPVIATFSQIRDGLKKLLKNFKPASSQLENFLTNHAASANRRLRIIDAAKSGRSVLQPLDTASAEAKNTASAPPTFPAAAADADQTSDDDFITTDPLEASGNIDDLEPAETDFEISALDRDTPKASTSHSPSSDENLQAQALDASVSDDFGDLSALDTDLQLDDEFSENSGSSAGEAAPTDALSDDLTGDLFAESSDGEVLQKDDANALQDDLDLFSEEKQDLAASLDDAETPEASTLASEDHLPDDLDLFTETSEAPAAAANSPLKAQAESPLSDSDLFGEESQDLVAALDDGEILSPAANAEANKSPNDLDLFSEESQDLGDSIDGMDASISASEETLAEENAGLEESLESLDLPAATNIAAEPNLAETPRAAEVDTDPTHATLLSMKHMTQLNRALFDLSLAASRDEALPIVAGGLAGVNITQGVFYHLSQDSLKALLHWTGQPGSLKCRSTELSEFENAELSKALLPLSAGFHQLDTDASLKLFSTWRNAQHKLIATVVKSADEHSIVVVAVWHQDTYKDLGVQGGVLELVRRITSKV